MKFFRLDLLTLLISLFILNSCKNQDTIGLGVNASNQLNGSLIDTSTIVINTIPEDSVYTPANSAGKIPMAYFKDPVFGTTEANIAFDLNLPASSYTPPAGTITIDSAILVLKYARGFYGDSIASKYKVNVYQLNERFVGSGYYNTKKWQFNNGTLLGTKSFLSRTNDSTTLVRSSPGKSNDITIKVGPQLRIPIDKNFINTILFNAPSSQLATNLAFKNAVKGLYVTLDKSQTTGTGGVFMFSGADLANIEIRYRSVNGTIIDTNVVTLSSSLHAAEIKHAFSTAVQTELANKTTSRNVFYIQGLAGLRAKISFPYLKKIIETVGSDIVINRAELVVTPVPGSTIPFMPLPLISMYRYDLANQRIPVADATSDPRGGILSGLYSITTNDYHFNITAHIEDLIRGRAVDNGTFLGAVDITDRTSTFAATATTAARTVAVGSDLASPYRVKLNIIYTKLAK